MSPLPSAADKKRGADFNLDDPDAQTRLYRLPVKRLHGMIKASSLTYVCVFRVASCQAWVSGHGKVEADGVVCARVRRCFPSVRRRTNGIPARGVLYVPGYLRWSSAPLNVVWCECQGALVLAPKCNNEKHNLAKDAATLLEKTIHPGVLCKLLMGASGIKARPNTCFKTCGKCREEHFMDGVPSVLAPICTLHATLLRMHYIL